MPRATVSAFRCPYFPTFRYIFSPTTSMSNIDPPKPRGTINLETVCFVSVESLYTIDTVVLQKLDLSNNPNLDPSYTRTNLLYYVPGRQYEKNKRLLCIYCKTVKTVSLGGNPPEGFRVCALFTPPPPPCNRQKTQTSPVQTCAPIPQSLTPSKMPNNRPT